MAVKKRMKDFTLMERIYIPVIAKGLSITLQNMFRKPYTLMYPEEKFIPTGEYRGRPVLVMEEDGSERCVACGLCARVCPPLAIQLQASETEREKERYPISFEINMLRCIFCGLCEEVCPEEAIVMSKDYEVAFESRQDAIFGLDRLLTPIEELRDRIEFVRANK
ncbi:MAG: NADH-quinone oxidoreductase subunit I [Ignavibacteriales bacterium]|jgi:NADH-quinone oxidoreductase, chain I|nr:MAG: NADH-quinone oxidoreductase subunit I [Ignavibacteriaceae bacterium]MBW7873460.1 NADH-quinone oxidoreductase subunit I [Ignavibacteria bacterium]MCZ2142151.1 NADH-quinone oxidoreductase subunit I [Ignavibacteriales bacterium]OQY70162.1 MAG: NADH-quinone oxidoreductase subunit I [Ignavibacteriales bacterium UTCHB3]MBV6444886.1 NADH-quinone oxidoreductase subunit I [Ignavibacteriaceae bacterium]